MANNSPIQFCEREQDLLRKHFRFYRELADGTRKPSTAAQIHFVAVCRGRATADTEHELLWMKHLRLAAWERAQVADDEPEAARIPEFEEGTPRPGWFTDEDWEKLRRRDFADMKKRNKNQ